MSKAGIGDICEKCFDSLRARLEEEVDILSLLKGKVEKPKAPKETNSDRVIGGIVGDDDGIAMVPSKLTPSKVRELNRSKSEGCDHSTGFSMEDDGPHCKDCGEKVRL